MDEAAAARPESGRSRAGSEPADEADGDLEPDRGPGRPSPRPAQRFYPGDGFVDMVGNDIYATRRGTPRSRRTRLSTARIQTSRTRCPSGALGRRPGLRDENLPLPDDGEPDEARRLLRHAALRPRLQGARAGGVPPLHHAPRAERADPDRRSDQGRRARGRLRAPREPGEAGRALGGRLRRQAAAGHRPPPATLSHTYADEGRVHGDPGRLPPAALRQHRVRTSPPRRYSRQQAGPLLQLTATRNAGKAPLSPSFRASATAGATGWEFVPATARAARARAGRRASSPTLRRRARTAPSSSSTSGPASGSPPSRSRALTPDAACEAMQSPRGLGRPHDEQREIRELVPRCARAARRAACGRDRRVARVPVGRRRALPRARDLRPALRREHGGSGTGTLLALVAIEEVSKVCATSGLLLAVQELGSLGLKLAGSQAQKEAYLPRLASGEWLPAYALTEAGSGSDSAAMRTTAFATATEYVLNGGKRFITNAGVANLYTVFAKTDPDAGHSGISAFLVESDTPGFAVARAGAEAGHLGLDDGRADLRRLPHSRREPARRGGRGLQDRDADPRPLTPGRRRAGARDRAGRHRLRARVREDARDDGQADRAAPADRGQARGHGDRDRGGARPPLPLRADVRCRRRRPPS